MGFCANKVSVLFLMLNMSRSLIFRLWIGGDLTISPWFSWNSHGKCVKVKSSVISIEFFRVLRRCSKGS